MSGGELWGYIIGALGALIGLGGWMRNARGETSTQAAWMGTVNAKLDQIAIELSKLNDVRERIIVLERDVKTAHSRLDELKATIKEAK